MSSQDTEYVTTASFTYLLIGVISSFRHKVYENRVFLVYYVTYSGNSLPTLRKNI